MKKNERLKVVLLVIMASMFIFSAAIRMPAHAFEKTDETQANSELIVDNQTHEILSMRTLYSESFLNDDGAITKIDYSEPIFYEENGSFKRIDNSIIELKNNNNGFKYYNATNNHRVFFRDAAAKKAYMEMCFGQFCISAKSEDFVSSVNMVDSNYEYANIGNSLVIGSSVLYSNISYSADIVYRSVNTGIRSNIIIKDKGFKSNYSIEYSFPELQIMNKHGKLVIYSRDNVVAELTRPIIVDADGIVCGTVSQNAVSTNTLHSAVVSYSIDITQANPSYPLTVISEVRNGLLQNPFDLYVGSNNTVNEDSPYLMTGACGKLSYLYAESYLKFGYIGLPLNGYEFDGADISVFCLGRSTTLGTGLGSYSNGIENCGTEVCGTSSTWTVNTITYGGPTVMDNSDSGELEQYIYNTSTGTLIAYTSGSTVPSGCFVTGKYTYNVQGLASPTGYKMAATTLPSGGTSRYYFTVWASMDSTYTELKPTRTCRFVQRNNVSVRKITDRTYREEYPNTYQTKIDNYLSDIAAPFNSRWHIYFTEHSNVQDNTLPAADCPSNNNSVSCCDANPPCCGTTCSDNTSTPNHSKNHYRNWGLLYNAGQGNADITIGFFGFKPCSAGGLSLNWLSTVCQPNLSYWTDNYNRRTLQHEISHLFGCPDGQCTPGEACIMNGGFDNIASFNQMNIWCSNCTERFDRTAH